MKKLIAHLLGGVLTIYLAVELIPSVSITDEFVKTVIMSGLILGLVNFFLRPIIRFITFPIIIITFGLFLIIINICMILLVDILFPQLVILGILPLFIISIISGIINSILFKSIKK